MHVRLAHHTDRTQSGVDRETFRTIIAKKTMIIDVNDKLTLKNLMKRRRQRVIELIRQFNRVYHSRGIVVSLLNQKRRLQRGPSALQGAQAYQRGDGTMSAYGAQPESAFGNQGRNAEYSDSHSYSQIFGK